MRTRLTRAEQQEQTRQAIVDAAERRFIEHGFHATSVEQIAAEAGYTKGAVYSNFASKEDLFFAVYERRAERGRAELESIIDQAADPATGLETIAAEYTGRRRGDDGWLAVFFEFWAHVIRQPDLRERFARIHAGAYAPVFEASERYLREDGRRLPMGARAFAVALNAMQIGLSLERLTQPDLVDADLGAQMARLQLDQLGRNGGKA